MERPNKKDYNFSNVFEVAHFIKKMTDYADYLENKLDQCSKPIITNIVKSKNKPSVFNWILHDKLKIEKGTTYSDPKITVRQCASWISEYVKTYCK